MDRLDIKRWQVGAPPGAAAPHAGRIALHADEAAGGSADRPPRWFHEVARHRPDPAPEVELWLPPYRGKSLVPVLSWLATERLADPGAPATWCLDRRQGPDSIARLLTRSGWTDVGKTRRGRLIHLHGRLPERAEPPTPERFAARLGGSEIEFEADYGVFSPRQVDAGTALLAEVALAEEPVPTVADIGVGYGALAIGLVRGGVAGRAVATDVDSVALWLAGRNADRHAVPLEVRCDPDPTAVPPTRLTVCNVPTHIDAARSQALIAGLIARARAGRLLIVVHRGLEERYARQLVAAGLRPARHRGATHTVLTAGAVPGRLPG
jgi:16S rRNA G1207 methylase RsmC